MRWLRKTSFANLVEKSWNVRAGTLGRLAVTVLVAFLTIYHGVQFAGYDTLLLIVKALLFDAWHVSGTLRCSRIVFRGAPRRPVTASDVPVDFLTVWNRKFNSPAVVDFREDYLRNCQRTTRTLSAVVSSNRLTSPGLGLGSNINFVLNLFLLAKDAVAPRRNFQLYVVDWNYVSWSELFQDFTAKSPCSIIHTMDPNAFQSVNQSAQTFDLDSAWQVRAESANDDHLLRELNSDGYWNFYQQLTAYEASLPNGVTFRKKSLLARSLLDLQPRLKDVLGQIWSNLVKEGAVHIRRGDKTVTGESINFPISLYVRALRRLCHTNPGRCSRIVYVFCDDAEVCADFVNQAKECFHVTDFRQQVKLKAILPWSERSPVEFRHQNQFNSLPAEERLESAQEMIVSIYLAALSDFFVCTYSSNVCRLVALLKHDNIADLDKDILSLDWSNWIMV
ncbi:hypothetical protein BV898_15534 [Hypsibius exemplaris]|uniref:Uncharacterized protein n=1 Tax=Hypsibius exemplaris TaxID=2072580 RepID=A0A9X6NB81_HYPEX|nr:hypothetical protein BV898_15534 [Hypsibius exemplaris]